MPWKSAGLTVYSGSSLDKATAAINASYALTAGLRPACRRLAATPPNRRATAMSVGVYDLTESVPVPIVVTPADTSANFADWSPDGSMIAYQGGNPDPFAGGARSDIFISTPDGSGARRLTNAEQSGVSYALPSWSADGRLLLITVIRPAGDYRIAWIDVASGDVRELTSATGAPIVGAHAVQCCA